MATSDQPSLRTQVAKVPVARTGSILLLAAVARLVVVVTQIHPFTDYCDQKTEVVGTATSLVAGHGFGSPFFAPSGPTAFLTPGYPLLVAAIFHLFGKATAGAVIILLLQVTFAVATVWLVMRAARVSFGMEAANIAGFVCAIFFPLLRVPLLLWETSLSSLLLMAVIVLARRTQTNWLSMGALCAIGGLVNPALLPTVLLLCAFAAYRAKVIPWLGILTFLVVFGPWPLRNALVMHSFIPVRSNFGYELWIGNHQGGDGDFVPALHPQNNAAERELFVREGELGYMRDKTRLAQNYIHTHQREFAYLTLARIERFWAGTADGAPGGSIPLLLLSVTALVLLLLRREFELLIFYALPLVVFPLPYYITHADVRFEYILDPLLALLSGYSIEAFLDFLKHGQWSGTLSSSAQGETDHYVDVISPTGGLLERR